MRVATDQQAQIKAAFPLSSHSRYAKKYVRSAPRTILAGTRIIPANQRPHIRSPKYPAGTPKRHSREGGILV